MERSVEQMPKNYLLKNGAKPHKLTRKDNSKGGKTRTIAKSLSRRKYCNSKCPLYPCVALAIYGSPDGLCTLKKLPYKTQLSVLRLHENKIIQEYKFRIFELQQQLELLEAKKEYSTKTKLQIIGLKKKIADGLVELNKMVFGEKHDIKGEFKIPFEQFVEWAKKDVEK